MSSFILHNYFRSSTSVRVRAALNLKGLEYEYLALSLLEDAHEAPKHTDLNRQGLVPTLMTDAGPLTQSMAILEWLDESYPTPPLLPADPLGRARVRSLAHIIALDIHPVNNLQVLRYIETTFGADAKAKAEWFRTWAREGRQALETRLAHEPETGVFCHGDTPGMADLCLYAQVINNERFDLGLEDFPTIARIHAACMTVPPLIRAIPANQPDAV